MELFLKRLEQAGMFIAVFAMATIMILVSLDAVLRYGFNSPLRWVFEIVTYYLMVIALYFSLSATFTHGDHIGIDLLRDMMPRRLRNVLDIIWVLASAVVFGFMAYGTGHHTLSAWENNDFIPGYILWPSWLSHLAIPLGITLLVLRLVHHAIMLIVAGDDPSVEEHGDIVE